VASILIWSPNYAPELTGIPPLVTDAAEWLAARGHRVDVVTAVPNYPERLIHPDYRGVLWRSERRGDVLVHRSWLRVRPEETVFDKVLYEFTFATMSLPQALRRLPGRETLVCVVPSLVAAVYASLIARSLHLARRGPRFVLWVQDLVFSAASSVHGVGPRARRLFQASRLAERGAGRAAEQVVVCSPGFHDYFAELGLDERRLLTIPNWVDVDEIPASPPPANGRTRFLYAGNLGYTQGFETLVEAARLAGPEVEVEIVGDGNAAVRVRSLAADVGNVTVRAPVPRSDFPALLASAHVDLVLQRRVSAGANFPSKIASYLASGRPIIASIAAETPAARVLEASHAALVVSPEEPQGLASAMMRLHTDDTLRKELGRAGREYAVQTLDRRAVLPRLEKAILG
jgi:colanic acid biosynthesis glycosyl transferase WcaI